MVYLLDPSFPDLGHGLVHALAQGSYQCPLASYIGARITAKYLNGSHEDGVCIVNSRRDRLLKFLVQLPLAELIYGNVLFAVREVGVARSASRLKEGS
jgi:hypothetical protein